MAPIRRYLRITKYSVLECRIYLDNPALAESWLLNSRNPILPQVIESVRPFVIPKLKEENERSRGKGNKKKGVKDVVVEEDFEVSIFLTETSARHSILHKQKFFRDLDKKEIQSNSQRLMGATNDVPIHVEDTAPVMIREESEDEGSANISQVPLATAEEEEALSDPSELFVEDNTRLTRQSKRPHASRTLNIAESSESLESEPSSKRRRGNNVAEEEEEATDDKKKMAMDTSYDGFSIYGRVLCLVVKRKDKKGKATSTAGQAMMEDWIASTQMPVQDDT